MLLTEPVTHVGRLSRRSKWLKLFDKQVDIASDDRFLLKEGLLAESMGQSTALTRVIGIICHS